MNERRVQQRHNILEETVAACFNQQCRVLDVGHGGLSLIYVHPVRWPDSLVLNLKFPAKDFMISGIKCSTVWENGNHSLRFREEGLFRRRGLRFNQPHSREVRILLTLVEHWNDKNSHWYRRLEGGDVTPE